MGVNLDSGELLAVKQVNRDLMGVIESFKQEIEEEEKMEKEDSEESSEGAETINENFASDVNDSSLNASPELESPEKDEDKVDEDEEVVKVDLEKDDAKVVDVVKGGVKRAYKKKKASDVNEAVVETGGAKTKKRKAETINENVASDADNSSLNASPELESPEKDEDKVDEDEQVVKVDLEKDDAKVVDVVKGRVKRAYKKKKASDVNEAVVESGGARTRKRKAVTPAVVA